MTTSTGMATSRRIRNGRAILLLSLAALATACGGTTALSTGDAGDGDAGISASPLDGTWTGYDVENYGMATHKMVLTLKVTGSTVTGTFVYGDALAPPPLSDPSIGYPPGYDQHATIIVEGFAYTIRDGTFDGSRLKITGVTAEVWSGWCPQQKSYASKDGSRYGCVPPDMSYGQDAMGGCEFYDSPTSTPEEIDCSKLYLCKIYGPTGMGVCSCDANGCTAPSTPDFEIDLQVAGTKADGRTNGQLGLYDVHLTHGP